MPHYCVAFGCSNTSGREEGITFHSFPHSEELKQRWIKAVKRKDWQPTKWSKLCSAHFREIDIDRTSKSCVRIREGAVPGIFPGVSEPMVRLPEERKFQFPSTSKTINSEDTVKSKWRNLRDHFNKEFKKIVTPNDGESDDSTPVYKGKWPHFHLMLFLKEEQNTDSMEYEDTDTKHFLSSNQEEESHEENSHTQSMVEFQDPIIPKVIVEEREHSSPMQTTNTNAYGTPETFWPPKKKFKPDPDSLPNIDIEMLRIVLQKLESLEKPDEDDLSFFKSLIPYFKMMNPINKLKLRSKIQNLVIDEVERSIPSLPGRSSSSQRSNESQDVNH